MRLPGGSVVLLGAALLLGAPLLEAQVREGWVSRLDHGPGENDSANAIVADPLRQRLYVAGRTWSPSGMSGGSLDYLLAGLDARTGQVVWSATYDGPGSGHDQAFGLALDAARGRLFVTGYAYGDGTQNVATVAYQLAVAGIVPLWVATYDSGGDDAAWTMALGPDGATVYVAGNAGTGAAADALVVAYDAATGAQRWAAEYGGPGAGEDVAWDLAVTPDGTRVYAAAQSAGTGTNLDYATLAYDAATGAPAWVARYDGPGHSYDVGRGIALAADGSRVIITGQSKGLGDNLDAATVGYDVQGNEAWVARHDGLAQGADGAFAVEAAGDAVFVTGGTAGAMTDVWAAKYRASDGALLWTASYDGQGLVDFAYGMVLTADAVVVAGESFGSGMQDYATVAFSQATGARLWDDRYAGDGGPDSAHALAAMDGKVYVTGRSAAIDLLLDAQDDVITIAYG